MTSLGLVLDGAEVVVCCGSGGVGKTTTAAVIGMEAARLGRRAVVVTIDPARRLADALGLPDGLGTEPQQIPLPDRPGELWAMMLDTATAFDALVRRNAGDDEQAARILANPFYRNMSGALSGTQEYMAAETLHQLHADGRFDLVVVDTPPSRNALDFLEASGVLARFLDHRLFRLMMLPARGGMRVVNRATQPLMRAIGKVVGSEVLVDAVAFFQAFAGMEAGFRQRADDVIALLRSDATRYVIVASPHRDTVSEAVWFAAQLADQGITRLAGVANRVHPPFGPGTSSEAMGHAEEAAGVLAALWRNVAELRALAEAAGDELAPFAAMLGGGPLATVPLLGGDVHDLAGLGEIQRHLFGPGVTGSMFRGVKVLLATDAQWLVDDVVAVLGAPDTSFTVCSEGRDVAKVVQDRTAAGEPFDIGIFDLQIGSMGGMAVTMAMRLDASSGRLPHVPVLMLLDRVADVFLARRSGADGWIVKPLDPLRLRRAVRAVVAGGTYHEGLPAPDLVTVAENVPDVVADGTVPSADAIEPGVPVAAVAG